MNGSPASQQRRSPAQAAANHDDASPRFPLAQEIPYSLDAEQAFLCLADLPFCIFLDSSLQMNSLGRYSFIAADPFETVVVPRGAAQPLNALRDCAAQFSTKHDANLPPFQGGIAGVFAYELGQGFEQLPTAQFDEFGLPAVAVGVYDVVVAFDHVARRAWIISQGFPESDEELRLQRATARIAQVAQRLQKPDLPRNIIPDPPVAISAPTFHVDRDPNLLSNFGEFEYRRAVAKVIEYIRAGDIFQANLTQRLLTKPRTDPVTLYRRLRARTRATFGGYFDAGSFQLASASPERFLAVTDRQVEARPIKGTRPRVASPMFDMFAAQDLLASAKDRGENIMIVDLMRNDLSRVCEDDSVHVPQLCALESYGYVQHLVSCVRGTLRADCDPLDLIAAAFPGGSITGAPKLRAMEIITQIERVARGPYCGSLGYLSFSGEMDLNILIRTITIAGGWWQLQVGGGIVADSNPREEYAETWHKAAGLLRALD